MTSVNARLMAAALLSLACAGAAAQAPPFWARPRAPAPADCVTTATPKASGGSTLQSGLLGAAALALFGWMVRVQLKKSAAARAAIPRAESSASPATPAPRHDDLAMNPLSAIGGAGIEMHDPEKLGANEAVRFYAEVAASLVTALQREPEREDLQLKLLEIYHAAGRVHEFVQLARVFFDQHFGTRGRHWPAVWEMGARLAPDHPLFREARPAAEGARGGRRGASPFRRFNEVNLDQGRIYGAQKDMIAQVERVRGDPAFHTLVRAVLVKSARRPSPVTPLQALAGAGRGGQLYLKREDQRRGHDDVRINALCQTLLARQLGRTIVVTATRSGLHGQAVASAAQRFGLECTIYISESAMIHHYTDVLRMRELGAFVRPVKAGDSRYADPRQFALDDAWLNDPEHVMYISDLDGGPDPYPAIVREFQMTVGREAAEQLAQLGTPAAAVVAGAADGYQGLGLLHAFESEQAVSLHYVGPKTVPGFERERHRLKEIKRMQWVPGDHAEGLLVLEQLYPEQIQMSLDTACTLAVARKLAAGLSPSQSVLALVPSPEDTGSREFARKM